MSHVIGRFYGVGVGPGDPELLTLRAHRILSRVPVIVVPQKDSGSESYAQSIIAGLLRPEQQVVEMVFPMKKDQDGLAEHWRRASETIWQHLRAGEDCAFVNLGDPLLYGTFIYVFRTLLQDHPEVAVEVVPGISSINAAAARALVPLASADGSVAIIPAGSEVGFVRGALRDFDTVVFLKVHKELDRLLAILGPMGLVDKCVYVRRATTPDEEIVRDIRTLQGQKLDYFSLLIVRR